LTKFLFLIFKAENIKFVATSTFSCAVIHRQRSLNFWNTSKKQHIEPFLQRAEARQLSV